MDTKPLSIAIAGSGTAGLLSAIMLRQAFPHSEITVISSAEIGIVGVGEGSTEHWKLFMQRCDIPLLEMVAHTKATHKYGIRFENWSQAFPDYMHSIWGDENIYAWRLFPLYSYLIHQGKPLTRHTASMGLFTDKIKREKLHENTNQFHFDTFALNRYFQQVAFRRGVRFIEGIIDDVNLDPTHGTITSVTLQNKITVEADFWIDATGFKRVLSSKVNNSDWNSFSDYLLCDSAFAFPTESDPNGKIRAYTRARALSSGWAWEIPTQERRGNGYVFSSAFCSPDKAVDEMSALLGRDIEPARSFKFDPGYLRTPWTKNCCAMGLSSSFVEPLEATSIGSTIQSLILLIPYMASYQPHHSASQKAFNKSFDTMMDNILTMIRLHYISDRRDTEFWRAVASMKINDSLQELLDLWQETTIPRDFIAMNDGQMFGIPHLIHVAQGQNVINRQPIPQMLANFGIQEAVTADMWNASHKQIDHELVDHAESFNEIF